MAKRFTKAIKEVQGKPGGSNVGAYKGVKKFAGPAGGAPKGSFPINTLKRGKAALSFARDAPKPKGIQKAVFRAFPALAGRSALAKKIGASPRADRKKGTIGGMKKK